MRKTAIAASYRKMTAADSQVMRASDVTVTARGRLDQLPEVITTNLRVRPFLADILNTGNKHAGRPAIIAGDLGLIGNCLDNLICNFPAMITISAVTGEDEPIAHGR